MRVHPEQMSGADLTDILQASVDCDQLAKLCHERAATEIGWLILEAFDRTLDKLNEPDAEAAEQSDIRHDRQVDDSLTEATA